jgi:hypothetical protein
MDNLACVRAPARHAHKPTPSPTSAPIDASASGDGVPVQMSRRTAITAIRLIANAPIKAASAPKVVVSITRPAASVGVTLDGVCGAARGDRNVAISSRTAATQTPTAVSFTGKRDGGVPTTRLAAQMISGRHAYAIRSCP